jgi:hypothetical protein
MIANMRNLYSWLHNSLHEVVKSHHIFLANVWHGTVDNHCGLHVTEGHLTAASYMNFLENELHLHLESVPLQTR